MKPSKGRIVLYRTFDINGTREHPAIITGVFSDVLVNLMVFPDTELPRSVTSVPFQEGMLISTNYAWRWPPRTEEPSPKLLSEADVQRIADEVMQKMMNMIKSVK